MRLYAATVASACVALIILADAAPIAAFADSSNVAAAKAMAALNKIDAFSGNSIATAAASLTDADSAAQTATTDIPADPTKGVLLRANDGQYMNIGLPNAHKLGNGIKQANGTVLYVGSNEADEVVVPTTTGVQFLTLINSANAPENYVYPAIVPQGGHTSLSSDGSAIILDANGKPVAVIAPPWAVDANHHKVTTKFTANGSTLTQHIAHKAARVAYPIVADPNVSFGAINFTLW